MGVRREDEGDEKKAWDVFQRLGEDRSGCIGEFDVCHSPF